MIRRAIVLALVAGTLLIASPADATRWGVSEERAVSPDRHVWVGKSKVTRVFEQGALDAWQAYPQLTRSYADGVRVYSISWKGASGQDVRDFSRSMPGDVTVYGTYWHEPEDDIEKGRLTLEKWKANTIRLSRVMRNHKIIPTRILMGWTLWPGVAGVTRNVSDYDLPAGVIAVSAFDGHVWNKGPRRLAKLLLAEKQRTGLPLALPETSGDPDRIAVLRKRLAGRMAFGCFWTYDGMTTSQAAAWFKIA